MIPILFESTSTSFTTNGIGRLSDAISCTVHEARNGEFELEMVYPVNGAHYSDIVHSAIIVAKPSARRSNQAFRIYKITRPISGKVTVLAQHISYQLSFIPVSPFSAASLANALAGFTTNAAEECPFTLTADFTSASSYAVPLPVSIRSYLGGTSGSILDVYGGEWEFDNYTCTLHKTRGEDNGYLILYGKNLLDLKQEESIENTYTGIYPYWQSEETMVTLSEKVIHANTASNFPFQRTLVKDFSDKFDNAPTEAQLRTYTQSFITRNGIGVPNVNLSLDFANLADTAEYRDILTSSNIDLCDTVTVRFEKLGVDVTSKVIEIDYDVLNERYKKIQIGDKRSTLSATIEDQIESVSVMATTDQMGRAIDRATGVLNAGRRGHVVINRNAEGFANEILFMDNENIADAVHVLRINMNGIGFSSTGIDGPYYQSWTLDGHFALGGNDNCFGDFEILDASGNALGEWDKDGLKLYDSAQNILIELNNTGLYLYDTEQNVLSKMTNEGLGVYSGVIDFNWGTDTGFYADGEKVQIGDFVCDSTYGRSIFQSSDEVTGMSAETGDEGELYLWAGYQSESNYVFVVNSGDAYVMYNGTAYPIGATLENLNNAVEAYRYSHSGDGDDENDQYENYTPPDPDDTSAQYIDHGSWLELKDGMTINDLGEESGEEITIDQTSDTPGGS